MLKFFLDFGVHPIEAPTIIYIPNIQYPNGYEIKVSDGDIDIKDTEQLVLIRTKKDRLHTIVITKIP